MKIVLIGPKGCGKSTVGKILANALGLPHVETDALLEAEYHDDTGHRRTCREILAAEGEPAFRIREARSVARAADLEFCVVSTGGSALLEPENRRLLRRGSLLVYLQADADVLWSRISKSGIPAFLTSTEPRSEFAARVARLDDIVRPYADAVVIAGQESPESVAATVRERIAEEMELAAARFSTLGLALQIHTFGESHGPAIGAVLDGVPSGIALSEKDIQHDLDRRRPGQSNVSTTRSEADQVRILSGVFEGKTTGAAVAMMIENKHQRSRDYEAFQEVFRPGHADFGYWAKYGLRDYRGGGRSSGRETAARVAGGAVAKKALAERGIHIRAYALEIGGVRAEQIDPAAIETNPVRCPDRQAAVAMEAAILAAREAKDSVGGIIQLEVTGVPAGLGDPVFAKLDARLGGAFFSVGAVKGVEFGAGFDAARLRGSENNDPMRDGNFTTNNAGGIAGGISTGQTILARIAVKPTPSVGVCQRTSDGHGKDRDLVIEGRHDPCIVPRAVPVIEAMAALVLLDCVLIQDRLRAASRADGSATPVGGGPSVT